jgi:glycosyltransferase involved in cell wall biosynthesis
VVALEEKDPARAESALLELQLARPIELLYERYALGAGAAGRFARRHGVPHVLEVNAPLLAEAAQHRSAAPDAEARGREGAILASADHVFAVSAGVADHVVELGVRRERVHVHPNAVDAERFHPRPSAERRRGLGVPSGAFVIGFHGRLRPWHGFERIAAAARGLLERGREVHVLAVGEGGFASVLDAAGMARHATCVPWVPHEDVPALVACFDALPLAYAAQAGYYFSPLKLQEAMACGVVPVVPDLGELPQLVGEGAAGLVYPAGSQEGLLDALESLVTDVPLRARLGAQAVELAGQRTWTAIAREALALARTGCPR